MEYRNTPVPEVGLSPAQILMGRRLATKLPVSSNLLNKTYVNYKAVKDKLCLKQDKAKFYYNRSCRERDAFEKGDNVVVRNGKVWKPGRIIEKYHTPRSYIVQSENKSVIRRNSSHLRKSLNSPSFINNYDDSEKSITKEVPIEDNVVEEVPVEGNVTQHVSPENTCTTRPKRDVKLPSKYSDYVVY